MRNAPRRLLLLLACALLGCNGGKTSSAEDVPRTGGDAERGREVIARTGCGACHSIPGVVGARGDVGPPLAAFAKRSYVAGVLPNTPENVVRWIVNPPATVPQTAMPALGLEAGDARDVTAYLYTLD